MLSANSTRDLNQAARSAAKYLKELGIELPHSKALDLVARLVGKPQHMAAQAALPAAAPTAGKMEPATALPSGQTPATQAVIADLCKVLVNRDVEQALYDVGISDAANAALAQATPFVEDQLLLDFPLDALSQAYNDLPTSVDEEEFVQGHGNWSLTEEEFAQAKRLANALYAAKRNRAAQAQALSDEDLTRLAMQFELATGKPANIDIVLVSGRQYRNDQAQLLQYFSREHGLSLSLGPWLIANDGEQGFWSNDFGWTTSRTAASGFDEKDVADMPAPQLSAKFGSRSRWVRFVDAVDYVDAEEPAKAVLETKVVSEPPSLAFQYLREKVAKDMAPVYAALGGSAPKVVHKSQGHPMYSAECVRVSHGSLDFEVTAMNVEEAVQKALDQAYANVFSTDNSDWYVSLLSLGGQAQPVPTEFQAPEPMTQASFKALQVPLGMCRYEVRVTREAYGFANVLCVLRPGEDLMDQLIAQANDRGVSEKTSEYYVEIIRVEKL